jgi:hypothetical protein
MKLLDMADEIRAFIGIDAPTFGVYRLLEEAKLATAKELATERPVRAFPEPRAQRRRAAAAQGRDLQGAAEGGVGQAHGRAGRPHHRSAGCMTRADRHAELKDRVRAWATRVRVEPKQIRVQRMSRKWASCSARGWCTFAYDLIEEPRAFQDYVIVHDRWS